MERLRAVEVERAKWEAREARLIAQLQTAMEKGGSSPIPAVDLGAEKVPMPAQETEVSIPGVTTEVSAPTWSLGPEVTSLTLSAEPFLESRVSTGLAQSGIDGRFNLVLQNHFAEPIHLHPDR